MAEEMLEAPSVHSLACQRVPGAVSQHVDVSRKRKFSGFTRPLDHASNPHAAKWLPALIHEHIGRPWLLLALEALQPCQFVALQIVSTIGAALQPADGNGALRQVKIIPAHVTSLAHPETVAVDQEPDQPVPMTVAVCFQGSKQLCHLRLCEVLADAIGSIRLASSCHCSLITACDQLQTTRFHCVFLLCCSVTVRRMIQNATTH